MASRTFTPNFSLLPSSVRPREPKQLCPALKAASERDSAGEILGQKGVSRERARKRQFSSEKLFCLRTDLDQTYYTLRRHSDAAAYHFSAFSPPRFARHSRSKSPTFRFCRKMRGNRQYSGLELPWTKIGRHVKGSQRQHGTGCSIFHKWKAK